MYLSISVEGQFRLLVEPTFLFAVSLTWHYVSRIGTGKIDFQPIRCPTSKTIDYVAVLVKDRLKVKILNHLWLKPNIC